MLYCKKRDKKMKYNTTKIGIKNIKIGLSLMSELKNVNS